MKTITISIALFLGTNALAETKTYPIDGMTCGGCVSAVKSEVCSLPGIETCQVEVGKMTLTSKSNLDDAKIKAALSKAGDYKIATPKKTK